MTALLFNLNSDDTLTNTLLNATELTLGGLDQRLFPDGETYLRVTSDCTDRDCVILCTLTRPDQKTLPLLFLAELLKELGARRVALVAPYLAYMRQDIRFKPGECVTSRHFAALLSRDFDYLITVDPHLHRYDSLDEIYSIPSHVVPAAPLIADWIQRHVDHPLILGPDSESEQWVAEVARRADAPYQVLEKTRRGDRDVSISPPELAPYRTRTPVLMDDIISSGHTMLRTIDHLRAAGMAPPVCIGTHGLFSDAEAYQQLQQATRQLVSSSTITHPTNAIDVGPALAQAVRIWLETTA